MLNVAVWISGLDNLPIPTIYSVRRRGSQRRELSCLKKHYSEIVNKNSSSKAVQSRQKNNIWFWMWYLNTYTSSMLSFYGCELCWCKPSSLTPGNLCKVEGRGPKPAAFCSSTGWNLDEKHYCRGTEISTEMKTKQCYFPLLLLYYFPAVPIAFIVKKTYS